LVALLGDIPDDERQVHFEMPVNPSDAEISAMLDLLADDSSDSVLAESLAVAVILEPEEILDIQRLDSTRPKRPRRANQPTSPAEGKKKRRLRRVSCLNQDADPSVPTAEGVCVELSFGADPNGCDLVDANPNGCNPADLDDADPNGCGVHIVDEDEEEEEEVPLIRRNNRCYVVSGESSEIPSPALFALVGLQELSLANFDQALKDVIPEDLLSEPADGGVMDACTDLHDVGLELSQSASHASSTLGRGLQSQEVDPDCFVPMEMAENPPALEVAGAESSVLKDGAGVCLAPEGIAGNDPAQVGSANCDPVPEDIRAGSPFHASMEVHVGCSPLHSDCMAATRALNQEIALEAGVPDTRVLIPVGDTMLAPDDAPQIASIDDPSSSHQQASHDLGLPSFVSNLLVIGFS
jgi:hypothetical protein